MLVTRGPKIYNLKKKRIWYRSQELFQFSGFPILVAIIDNEINQLYYPIWVPPSRNIDIRSTFYKTYNVSLNLFLKQLDKRGKENRNDESNSHGKIFELPQLNHVSRIIQCSWREKRDFWLHFNGWSAFGSTRNSLVKHR